MNNPGPHPPQTPATPTQIDVSPDSSVDGPLARVGVDVFYRDYWQRRPLLIRNALPGLRPPLDADELAGLSCEEAVASRIITGTWEADNFRVEHGPIDEARYQSIGDRDWTLLVQDVDKLVPEAAQLLNRFDFLPAWRVDDLMLSFAAPGGSVGPHTDEYDVFLVQLQGRRRWQIAESFDPALRPRQDLKVLDQFQPEQEWVCAAGDILYLPPGVAHYGVALDACLTASVGLRAPSLADLLDDLANTWADEEQSPRYRDAGISPPQQRWLVDDAAVTRFRDLLRQVADAPETPFKQWLGSALGRYRLASGLLDEHPIPDHFFTHPSPATPITSSDAEPGIDLAQLMARHPHLERQPAARMHWLSLPGDQALLCANGEVFTTRAAIARQVCASSELHGGDCSDLALVSFLLNSSAFRIAE